MRKEIRDYARFCANLSEYDEPNLAGIAALAITDFESGLVTERYMIQKVAEFLDDVLEESERVDQMRAWVNRKYFELV